MIEDLVKNSLFKCGEEGDTSPSSGQDEFTREEMNGRMSEEMDWRSVRIGYREQVVVHWGSGS